MCQFLKHLWNLVWTVSYLDLFFKCLFNCSLCQQTGCFLLEDGILGISFFPVLNRGSINFTVLIWLLPLSALFWLVFSKPCNLELLWSCVFVRVFVKRKHVRRGFIPRSSSLDHVVSCRSCRLSPVRR